MSIYNGWTPTPQTQPATKAQLIALRDLLLSHGDKNAAAAVDNVIDILTITAKKNVWDFTPIPEDMPIINFDNIDPIAF